MLDWVGETRSCLVCDQCLSGHHNRCLKGEDVIVGRHGAYANKVHCQALWAFPLPEKINPQDCCDHYFVVELQSSIRLFRIISSLQITSLWLELVD